MTCCPIAPYVPSIWDPHRQAEPVRLWWIAVRLPSGEQIGVIFRGRAQELDAKKRAAGERLGGFAFDSVRMM